MLRFRRRASGRAACIPSHRFRPRSKICSLRSGLRVLDGPEVETEEHNFDALNIPPTHPGARHAGYVLAENGHLLRTHTSPVQVRGMRKLGPPLRMIAPDACFAMKKWTLRTSTRFTSSKA